MSQNDEYEPAEIARQRQYIVKTWVPHTLEDGYVPRFDILLEDLLELLEPLKSVDYTATRFRPGSYRVVLYSLSLSSARIRHLLGAQSRTRNPKQALVPLQCLPPPYIRRRLAHN